MTTQLRSRGRTNCIHALVVCAAAGALLLARNSTPVFRNTSSVRTVNADVRHDHRLRFVDNAPQLFPVAAGFTVCPPRDSESRLASPASLVVSFPEQGVHYDRPPPIL
jgi:hypothetical protein